MNWVHPLPPRHVRRARRLGGIIAIGSLLLGMALCGGCIWGCVEAVRFFIEVVK